jgi:glycosyltransferase involved in cell wall biosynthesis
VLSVVVPAHNEQDYLEPAVTGIIKGLRSRNLVFEVIICENGSTDDTAEVARELHRQHPHVRTLSLREADYGRALQTGFEVATGDLVANFDVDYIDLGFLDAALRLRESPNPPSVVLASKRSAGARDTRSFGRRLVTTTFSIILKLTFRLRVSDTHGMKLLSRPELAPIVRSCRFGRDLFDTEMILRAERAGLAIAELPVTVRDTRPSRTSIVRRIPRSLAGLAELRLALWQEEHRLSAGNLRN